MRETALRVIDAMTIVRCHASMTFAVRHDDGSHIVILFF